MAEVPADLNDIMERMKAAAAAALAAADKAVEHMKNAGDVAEHVEIGFELGQEPDDEAGPEIRGELNNQLDRQLDVLKHMCEQAALVPEFKRCYDAHGYPRQKFALFLAVSTKGLRNAEDLQLDHILSVVGTDEPLFRERSWTLRDARRYQELRAQWAELVQALDWMKGQSRFTIESLNLASASKLIAAYRRR